MNGMPSAAGVSRSDPEDIMGVKNSAVRHDDAWRTEMVGHVAGYAIGGVLLVAILYVAALYFWVG
jgi:hypothetical protein